MNCEEIGIMFEAKATNPNEIETLIKFRKLLLELKENPGVTFSFPNGDYTEYALQYNRKAVSKLMQEFIDADLIEVKSKCQKE